MNYVFADKYLLTHRLEEMQVRFFGVNSKWGNFPALSAGWNVHKEDFLDGSVFSKLKLRASYGLTGNEFFNTGNVIVDNYPYLALLNTTTAITGGGVTAGVSPLGIANDDLKWESSEEFNLELTSGF